WAALRFAQYGAVNGTFLVCAIAIAGTAMGLGPFVRQTLAESLLHVQAFLGVAAVTALTVAAAIAERSRAADARDEFLAMASHELRADRAPRAHPGRAAQRPPRRSGPGP